MCLRGSWYCVPCRLFGHNIAGDILSCVYGALLCVWLHRVRVGYPPYFSFLLPWQHTPRFSLTLLPSVAQADPAISARIVL